MSILSYRDLDVWKKAMGLAKQTYAATESLPTKETYGLTSQLRRCAISIASNIAEGRGRRGTKEFLRFLDIASGSLAELETQLILAYELGYISKETADALFDQTAEIGRMINGLYNKLESKLSPESRMLDAESI